MKTRITDLFGIEHPPLVAAVSEAGGLGSLASGILPPEGLRALIRATRSLTGRPFAVNFITQFASDAHVDVCLDEEVPFVEFFWTHPADTFVQRFQARGVKVTMKVANVRGAREAAEAGVDAIITQSSTAGGHTKARLGTFALVPAVVDAVNGVPVISAGGVADGRGLAAALALGAEGVALTAIFGPEWPDQPMNCLRNRVVKEHEGRDRATPPQPDPPVSIGRTRLGPETYEMPKFSAILPTPDTEGDFVEMCLTAGQCAPLVRDVKPVARIIRDMVREAETLVNERLRRFAAG